MLFEYFLFLHILYFLNRCIFKKRYNWNNFMMSSNSPIKQNKKKKECHVFTV